MYCAPERTEWCIALLNGTAATADGVRSGSHQHVGWAAQIRASSLGAELTADGCRAISARSRASPTRARRACRAAKMPGDPGERPAPAPTSSAALVPSSTDSGIPSTRLRATHAPQHPLPSRGARNRLRPVMPARCAWHRSRWPGRVVVGPRRGGQHQRVAAGLPHCQGQAFTGGLALPPHRAPGAYPSSRALRTSATALQHRGRGRDSSALQAAQEPSRATSVLPG